jgi:hypothetical protein
MSIGLPRRVQLLSKYFHTAYLCRETMKPYSLLALAEILIIFWLKPETSCNFVIPDINLPSVDRCRGYFKDTLRNLS